MALKNYTTKIPAERTAAQIQELLAKHGATKIMTAYTEGRIAGVMWAVDTPHGEIGFKMPVNVDACHAVLLKQRKVSVRDHAAAYEHSRKVAWRIVKDWIEVQLALTETEMVSLDQVMLPYVVDRNDKTLYEHMIEGGFQRFAALEAPDAH